ncbi:hypothetical protein [Sphaerisporangium sp. TRM90804]|uniref:hypothetical protein n=1 Tax=Sphaerisporangium sp. TRM90804 TaxID=3031113 RepID=UPI0024488264|nr:hypothetical protein [Sphaerisporangium sp. TRM90804]MDH2430031.1 hypothetical protein [Sphaerisporangium sp. TRM90804]
MGVAPSDVVTSAPSTIGAASASGAAVVFPLARPLAVVLGAVVSDPAQIWHAGDRYAEVAKRVRAAGAEMAEAVERRAGSDDWAEKGKKAFLEHRVRPYQQTLAQAAAMYDDLDSALKGTAVAYSMAGVSSAAIGSAMLGYVAPLLAAAVLPPIEAEVTYVANTAMLRAGMAIRVLVSGLAKVNVAMAQLLASTAVGLGVKSSALTGLGILGTAVAGGAGGFHIGTRAAPAFEDAVRPVHWPKEVEGGAPAGFRAAPAAQADAMRRIHPASIKALGDDLDAGAGKTLQGAHDFAGDIQVGAPGFGAIGVHLFFAHATMRDTATRQLAAGRDTLGKWLPGLRTAAGNWVAAERSTTEAVNHGR